MPSYQSDIESTPYKPPTSAAGYVQHKIMCSKRSHPLWM